MNNIYEEKLEMLEDMSVCISDVIENTKYIQLYYPVDDAIRNRGKLTLLSPAYCDIFSRLLKSIFKRVNKRWTNDEDIIPKKGVIIKDMKMSSVSEEYNFV